MTASNHEDTLLFWSYLLANVMQIPAVPPPLQEDCLGIPSIAICWPEVMPALRNEACAANKTVTRRFFSTVIFSYSISYPLFFFFMSQILIAGCHNCLTSPILLVCGF
jgi:hypothetical protein